MNVLSLFDGISCGQIALNRAGIKYDNYFASEIDKHAIKVTQFNYPSTIQLSVHNSIIRPQFNYPSTIQLGDIIKINRKDLPKIDLLIGGSPCTNLSCIGDRTGIHGEQSKLFFEYLRLVKECNPKYFLLENVVMKKEYENIISENLEVNSIKINSALVSAQNRSRLYWTNIPNIEQPINKNIYIKDILDEKIDNPKGGAIRIRFDKIKNKHIQKLEIRKDNKTNAILTSCSKSLLVQNGKYLRNFTPQECERLQTVPQNYTSCISNNQRQKCLGNGWTVDVIAHIFSFIK